MSAPLQVNDLRVYYPSRRGVVKAVDGVSFNVETGERFGLIGESGSGKSTIALALMRLIRPPGRIESGSALLDGVNLMTLSDEQMRKLRLAEIALVTQGAMNSLNPVMRIRQQIVDALRSHGLRLHGREQDERVAELLESVDLRPEVADMFPHQLSGGMKQRVCIAIAISLRPKLIIADEPTSALDVVVQRRVMETLLKVQERIHAAVILIGHDMGLMAQFAERVAVMRAGRIVEVNGVRRIFTAPEHPYTRLLMQSIPSLDQKDLFVETPAASEQVHGGQRTNGGAHADRSATLIEAREVGKVFRGGVLGQHETIALQDFTLEIAGDRPSITAVVGESGSGKSTMARLFLGLETPTSGAIVYRGKPLRQLSGGDWRAFRRDVQAIFQDPFEVYNSFYKVDHVLTTPIRKFRLASSRRESRELIENALQAVGLKPDETLGRYPHQLSGGQRQRIMVARALLLRPKLIIADEPVSMIDASRRATVLATLHKLKATYGISLIYITHDLTTAYQISDHIIVLYGGKVVEAGDPERVVKQPQHPYTQLLISSIPQADPDRRWREQASTPVEGAGRVAAGAATADGG
ncbi:MAG TPA: ABC transporter ATP-binding protein [Herpetosiphonaceae bacterium]|nr:ABC transporter ATP-binding protein [Herpetosiphonaceae bacterium]